MRIFIATLCAVICCGCRSTQQSAIHEIDSPRTTGIAGAEDGSSLPANEVHDGEIAVADAAQAHGDSSPDVTSDTLPPRDGALASPLQLRLVSAQTEADPATTPNAQPTADQAAVVDSAQIDDIQSPSRGSMETEATVDANAASGDQDAVQQGESAGGASKPETDAAVTYLDP